MSRRSLLSPPAIRAACVAVLGLVALLAPGAGHAKAHLWRISEIFSNADGSVQFIELNECCGSTGEYNLDVTSITSNANTYFFPNDLPFINSTDFGWVLIATADFAALPGAPTPDYVIPANFFDPAGDTITYVGGADAATFVAGQLPTDGSLSLDRDITSGVLTVAVNSPTNFAEESGSVSPPTQVPGAAPWLVVPVLVGAAGWAAWRRLDRPAAPGPTGGA